MLSINAVNFSRLITTLHTHLSPPNFLKKNVELSPKIVLPKTHNFMNFYKIMILL